MIALWLPTILAEGALVVCAVGGCSFAAVFATRSRRHLATSNEAVRAANDEHSRMTDILQVTDDRLMAVRLAAESLPFGVVMIDSNGQEVLRNGEIAAVLGPESPSLDSEIRADRRSDGEVMAGGTLRRLLDRATDGQRGRESLDIVGPPRRSFVVTAEPIGDRVQGRFAALGTVQDSSEQRGAEAMRQDFITNVSHELRTPVGAIAILAETLAAETDPKVAARLTGRLEHEAHRLSAMVDDLLALGTVESGNAGAEEFVPVPELIDEAIERARVSAETRGLTVDVAAVGSGLVVRGDRRQLVTALHNLLENALKYSDKGQPVEVAASLTRVVNALGDDGNATVSSGLSMGPRIAIAVRDRGIGIPTRDQQRIFERFYRVDRARARDTGGSGLGLAIVNHVVRNHSGEITVSSTEGIGSTFTLLLPGYARSANESTPNQISRNGIHPQPHSVAQSHAQTHAHVAN